MSRISCWFLKLFWKCSPESTVGLHDPFRGSVSFRTIFIVILRWYLPFSHLFSHDCKVDIFQRLYDMWYCKRLNMAAVMRIQLYLLKLRIKEICKNVNKWHTSYQILKCSMKSYIFIPFIELVPRNDIKWTELKWLGTIEKIQNVLRGLMFTRKPFLTWLIMKLFFSMKVIVFIEQN